MKSNDTARKEKRRKLLLILPLFILPFVTMLFWAMGGGSTASAGGDSTQGFNLKLPSAKLKEDKNMDKLNYYDQASVDSTKIDELRRKDPNYRFKAEDSLALAGSSIQETGGLRMDYEQSREEEKVYKKLEALQQAISKPAPPAFSKGAVQDEPSPVIPNYGAELNTMMQSMNAPSQPDPEMEQIGGMLENILDLQYPERMELKMKEASLKNRGRIYGVSTLQEQQIIGSLTASQNGNASPFTTGAQHNGFYGLEQTASSIQDNAVQAAIAETQTVVNGSTVKMFLTQDVYVNGNKIPKNTYIYGTAALKGERLTVTVTTIRYGNSIYPVEMAVFDLDGLSGIYIPGAINREVAKASAERSVQTLGVTTLSDSWGAQAAGAGIEAAKGLFSRKVKLIKVTLKAGYSILLKDEKQE